MIKNKQNKTEVHRHTLAWGKPSTIISVKYLPEELKQLDKKRGKVKRSVFIRQKSLE